MPEPSLLTVISFFLPFITFYLGVQKEKGQSKKELILKFYPDLIKEFRDLDDLYENLLDGTFFADIYRFFENLLSMDKNSTLNIIEEIDPILTEPIGIIINDLIPALEEIDKERRMKVDEIETLWDQAFSKILVAFDVVNELNNLITNFNFVNRVSDQILWSLWKKDSKKAKADFMEHIKGINLATPNLISRKLSNKIYEKFSEIAKKEFKTTRDKIIEKGIQLKSIISEDVLPIMDARMSTVAQ